MNKYRGILAALLTMVMISVLLTGCGNQSSAGPSSESTEWETGDNRFDGDFGDSDYSGEAMPEEPAYGESAGSSDSVDLDLDTEVLASTVERQLTYTADVSIETKTYRETVAALESLVKDTNGYVAYSNVNDYGDESEKTYSRYATFEIQIPAGSMDGFLNALKEISNVTSTSKRVDDITQSYFDTKSRLEALEEQEKRLLNMQDQSDNMEEMLQIEVYLNDVRYEMNYLYNMMQVYEQQVAYSTVNIELNEVVDYSPAPVQDPTFGDRIVKAFQDMLDLLSEFGQGLVIALIFLLPVLVVAAVVVVIVVVCIRAKKKKKAKLLAEHPELAQPIRPAPPVYPYYQPQPPIPPAAVPVQTPAPLPEQSQKPEENKPE